MTPTTINYSESVETVMPNGLKRWRKLEIGGTIADGESFELASVDAQARLHSAFKAQDSMKPASTWEGSLSDLKMTDFNTGEPAVVQVEKQGEDQRIGVLVADINSCTELKVLESYKILAKTKPELQEAYNLKLKELSK